MHNADNTVINITNRVSPFPQDSTLYFPVIERPDGWLDKHGAWHKDDNVKKLVRVTDKKPTVLATVGKNYRVVLNRDLHEHIEHHMLAKFEPSMLRDVQVRDDMAYNGRDCFRHYTFPSIRCEIADGGDIAFKIIVGNGYGSKAVQLISGAIDFFCSNGMITGVHEKAVRKHTSGLSLTGLDDWLVGSINLFTKHTDRLRELTRIGIAYKQEEPLFKHLVSKSLMSERHAKVLLDATLIERNRRSGSTVTNPTLWHLYSALTAWASHDDVRDTGNDHAAVTRIERGRHVERVISAATAFITKRAA